MRRANDPVNIKKRTNAGGFVFKHIQSGPGNLARSESFVQISFIDDAAAGAVDNHNPIFH